MNKYAVLEAGGRFRFRHIGIDRQVVVAQLVADIEDLTFELLGASGCWPLSGQGVNDSREPPSFKTSPERGQELWLGRQAEFIFDLMFNVGDRGRPIEDVDGIDAKFLLESGQGTKFRVRRVVGLR